VGATVTSPSIASRTPTTARTGGPWAASACSESRWRSSDTSTSMPQSAAMVATTAGGAKGSMGT
jgi:hypothetical protein